MNTAATGMTGAGVLLVLPGHWQTSCWWTWRRMRPKAPRGRKELLTEDVREELEPLKAAESMGSIAEL